MTIPSNSEGSTGSPAAMAIPRLVDASELGRELGSHRERRGCRESLSYFPGGLFPRPPPDVFPVVLGPFAGRPPPPLPPPPPPLPPPELLPPLPMTTLPNAGACRCITDGAGIASVRARTSATRRAKLATARAHEGLDLADAPTSAVRTRRALRARVQLTVVVRCCVAHPNQNPTSDGASTPRLELHMEHRSPHFPRGAVPTPSGAADFPLRVPHRGSYPRFS